MYDRLVRVAFGASTEAFCIKYYITSTNHLVALRQPDAVYIGRIVSYKVADESSRL
jgi:hypothetical protein